MLLGLVCLTNKAYRTTGTNFRYPTATMHQTSTCFTNEAYN